MDPVIVDYKGPFLYESDYSSSPNTISDKKNVLQSHERTWYTPILEFFGFVHTITLIDEKKVKFNATINLEEARLFLEKVDPTTNLDDTEAIIKNIKDHFATHKEKQVALEKIKEFIISEKDEKIKLTKDHLEYFLHQVFNALKPSETFIESDAFIKNCIEALGADQNDGPFTIDRKELRNLLIDMDFKNDMELRLSEVKILSVIKDIVSWHKDQIETISKTVDSELADIEYDQFPNLRKELIELSNEANSISSKISRKETVDKKTLHDLSTKIDAIISRKNNLVKSSELHKATMSNSKDLAEQYGIASNDKDLKTPDTPQSLLEKIKLRVKAKKTKRQTKIKNIEKLCQHLVDMGKEQILIDGRAHKVTSIIGKLIYLIDNSELNFDLTEGNELNDILIIELDFENKMQEIQKKLQEVKDSYSNNFITKFPSEAAQSSQLSIEIATILIDSNGQLNSSIIDDVINQLLPKIDVEEKSELKKHIRFMLREYMHFNNINKELSSITKPDDKNNIGREIIRNALNLPIKASITDRHARIVAFAATLSKWRQGSAYTCYATAFLDQMLTFNPTQLLKDFRSILKEGFILRSVEGVPMKFLASLIAIQEPQLPTRHKFRLNLDGNVCNAKLESVSCLFTNPFIIKACKALKIPENKIEGVVKSAIKELSTNRTESNGIFEISIEEILTEIANTQSDGDERETRQLVNKALFAYQSIYQSPLLRATENALASMDLTSVENVIELLEESITHGLIEKCNIDQKGDEFQKLTAVLEIIFSTGNPHFQYLFSPDIQFEQHLGKATQKYYNGGFVLYEIDPIDTSGPNAYKLISTEEQFQDFLKNILISVYAFAKDAECTEFVKNLSILLDDVEKIKELSKTISDHYRKNRVNVARTLGKELETPPWKIEQGGASEEIFPVYWDKAKELQKSTVIPFDKADPTTQMKKLMGECFALRAKINHPSKKTRVFLTTENHSFNLLPAHSTITSRLNDESRPGGAKMKPEMFVKNFLEEGKELFKLPIDEVSINNITDYAKEKCSFNAEQQARFSKLIGEIKRPIGIQAYVKEIQGIILKVLPYSQAKSFNKETFNRELLSRLSPQIIKSTLDKAVYFADSNWQANNQPLYFAYIVNPITQEVDVILCDDDKNIINTNYSLKGKQLVLFTLEGEALKEYDKTTKSWAKKLAQLKDKLLILEAECERLDKEVKKPDTAQMLKIQHEQDYIKKVKEYHTCMQAIESHYKQR